MNIIIENIILISKNILTNTTNQSMMNNYISCMKRHVHDIATLLILEENNIKINVSDKLIKLLLHNKNQPEQRSKEWLELRKSRITASEAASAIGMNKYTSTDPEKCIIKYVKEKAGLVKSSFNPIFTQFGNKYEPIANQFYEQHTNNKVFEGKLIEHPYHKILAASPDGIVLTPDGNVKLLEIKCPAKQKPLNRSILHKDLQHYWIQMQLQMQCCSVDTADFLDCEINEYNNEYEYDNDETFIQKGILVELLDGKNERFYKYPSFNTNKESILAECNSIIEIYKDNKPKLVYWKLNSYTLTEISIDKQWFDTYLPKFYRTWKAVTKLRESSN
jgi:putative phage-type endonuclease